MRPNVLPLMIVALLSCACKSQPDLKVIGSTTLDFGKSNIADTLKGHFLLTNIGSKKLVIKGIQASCECVSTILSDSIIEYGDTVRLDVAQVPSKAGEQQRILVIATNGANPLMKLTTTAIVR